MVILILEKILYCLSDEIATGRAFFLAFIAMIATPAFELGLPDKFLVPSGKIPKILPSFKIFTEVFIAFKSLPLRSTGKAFNFFAKNPSTGDSNNSFFAIK